MHRLYITVLGAIGLMSLLAAALNMRAESAAGPQATITNPERNSQPEGWDEAQALTLQRDSSGQFHTSVNVNGEGLRFLVDTGADTVALTLEDAETLGLVYGEMQPIVRTASGVGYGAPVRLEEVEVAGTVLRDVDAIVVQDLAVNLLGQTVLRRLGAVELKGDTMVIRTR